MILNDLQIRKLATHHDMIRPYYAESVRRLDTGAPAISFGESSYGYDIAISNEANSCQIFVKSDTPVDPKNFDADTHLEILPQHHDPDTGETWVIIPPNTTMLARSAEYLRIPPNVTGICLGKSTYARSGLTVLATPLEAGWEGHITLEIANVKPSPAILYLNEGFMQVIFLVGDRCQTSYSDRAGKYQGQTGLTLPKV